MCQLPLPPDKPEFLTAGKSRQVVEYGLAGSYARPLFQYGRVFRTGPVLFIPIQYTAAAD